LPGLTETETGTVIEIELAQAEFLPDAKDICVVLTDRSIASPDMDNVELVRLRLKRCQMTRFDAKNQDESIKHCQAIIEMIGDTPNEQNVTIQSLLAMAHCEMGICLNTDGRFDASPFETAHSIWSHILQNVDLYKKG
jgi:hypothetical protein